MPVTKISDVVVPEVFLPYVQQRTMELSALFEAGIVTPEPRLELGLRAGGETVNMPYWNDLDGDPEELSDARALTPSAITSGQDVAVVHALGKAWGMNDLAAFLAGDDPLRNLGDAVARFWGRAYQKRLINTVKGIAGAASFSGNVLDISGETGAAAVIDGLSFVDAKSLLGDASDALVAVAMHSAVVAKLEKDDLIDTIKPSEGMAVRFYQGKRVIVDDSMPVASGFYTTVLFGPGAFGSAEGTPKVPVETERSGLAGEDYLINRRIAVLHPRGVKWKGSSVISSGDASAGHPSLADLASQANWERVYPNKAIRIVAFKHRIAAVGT